LSARRAGSGDGLGGVTLARGSQVSEGGNGTGALDA
jgi:hypothetical protein